MRKFLKGFIQPLKDLIKAFVETWPVLLACIGVSIILLQLGDGTDADVYIGLSIEIAGTAAVLFLFKGMGESDSDKITQLQNELAEIKALLIQQNTPTESD